MRSNLKRRLNRLTVRDDELVDLGNGKKVTWAEWRAIFERVLNTPDPFPVRIDPEVAKKSLF